MAGALFVMIQAFLPLLGISSDSILNNSILFFAALVVFFLAGIGLIKLKKDDATKNFLRILFWTVVTIAIVILIILLVNFFIREYSVEFDVISIKATVDGVEIASGDLVQEGKIVIFEARAIDDHKVKPTWILNGVEQEQEQEQDNSCRLFVTAPDTEKDTASEDYTYRMKVEFIPEYPVNFRLIGDTRNNKIIATKEDGKEIQSGAYVQKGKKVTFKVELGEDHTIEWCTNNGEIIESKKDNTFELEVKDSGCDLIIKIKSRPMHGISVSPPTLEFTYGDAPSSVTIKNTGRHPTGPLAFTPDPDFFRYFELTGLDGEIDVPAGEERDFKVRPRNNLEVGTWSETITISGSNEIKAELAVSVKVGSDHGK